MVNLKENLLKYPTRYKIKLNLLPLVGYCYIFVLLIGSIGLSYVVIRLGGYRHKPGQNFHGKKNKRRALNIKFGLDKVL